MYNVMQYIVAHLYSSHLQANFWHKSMSNSNACGGEDGKGVVIIVKNRIVITNVTHIVVKYHLSPLH
jgi:hypothetical protein